MVTVSSISRGSPQDPLVAPGSSADDAGPPSGDSISSGGSDADKKYVLQIKLKPHEKAAVLATAKATFLPLATWARQIVLRGAGLGRSEPTKPAVAVSQTPASDRPGRAARGSSGGGKKNKRSKSR